MNPKLPMPKDQMHLNLWEDRCNRLFEHMNRFAQSNRLNMELSVLGEVVKFPYDMKSRYGTR